MTMPQVTVVAKVRSELLRLIAPTRNEDGCIEYRLHQDHDDPAVFIFYENWENESSLARHMERASISRTTSAPSTACLWRKNVHRMTMIG